MFMLLIECVWLWVVLAVSAPDFRLMAQANIKAVMLAYFFTQPMQHLHTLIAPECIGRSASDRVFMAPNLLNIISLSREAQPDMASFTYLWSFSQICSLLQVLFICKASLRIC
ncbi:TPA: hypothetical protein ACH3X1_001957 [Trebouxia sp. C0004]